MQDQYTTFSDINLLKAIRLLSVTNIKHRARSLDVLLSALNERIIKQGYFSLKNGNVLFLLCQSFLYVPFAFVLHNLQRAFERLVPSLDSQRALCAALGSKDAPRPMDVALANIPKYLSVTLLAMEPRIWQDLTIHRAFLPQDANRPLGDSVAGTPTCRFQ